MRMKLEDHPLARERRLFQASKLCSPCLKGRLRHKFYSNRPTKDADKCWWCGKTWLQVKTERKKVRNLKFAHEQKLRVIAVGGSSKFLKGYGSSSLKRGNLRNIFSGGTFCKLIDSCEFQRFKNKKTTKTFNRYQFCGMKGKCNQQSSDPHYFEIETKMLNTVISDNNKS